MEGKQLSGYPGNKHLQAEDGRGRRWKEPGSLMTFPSCSFKLPWDVTALEAVIAGEKNWSLARFAITEACEQPNEAHLRHPHSLPAGRALERRYHKAKAPLEGRSLTRALKQVHRAEWRRGKGTPWRTGVQSLKLPAKELSPFISPPVSSTLKFMSNFHLISWYFSSCISDTLHTF